MDSKLLITGPTYNVYQAGIVEPQYNYFSSFLSLPSLLSLIIQDIFLGQWPKIKMHE